MTKSALQIKKEKKLSKLIINTFTHAGFLSAGNTEGIEIDVDGERSDFDKIFFYENNIIFVEETTKSNIDHIRKKSEFYKTCCTNKQILFDELKKKFPKIRKTLQSYTIGELNLIYLYVSFNTVEDKYQKRYNDLFFWDLKNLNYFLTLSAIIKKTARYEIFTSLGVPLLQQENNSASTQLNEYEGIILPEGASGFPAGYKIISFVIDPEKLLKQAYVLRKYAWLDSDHLYQRILIKNKITEMRKYLIDEQRTFLNNIIATLPAEIKIYDDKKNPITNNSKLLAGGRVFLEIPIIANNIGIIDGQHRIFSYHEGDDIYESKIAKIRPKRHLLVTAILYPHKITQKERESFEAKLFLEINDKQTRIKSSLKHVIYTVVYPYSDISISKRVIQELSKISPMNEVFETDFFDKGKLSTTSIVSYGVRYLVKLDGNDSLFFIWGKTGKEKLKKNKNNKLLDQYIKFCTKELLAFMEGFKSGIDKKMWTHNQKVSKVLTATTMNGLIHCLRLIIRDGKNGDTLYYKEKFKNIENVISFLPGKDSNGDDYFPYKSSHWKALGEEIYKKCF